jgi:hypothetical protein
VENAVRELKVTYPVAIDSNYAIWRAFNNQYWPAQYLIDARGRIRYHHFGEDDYDEIERAIQDLLKESGAAVIDSNLVSVTGVGIEAPPDSRDERSPRNLSRLSSSRTFLITRKIGQRLA